VTAAAPALDGVFREHERALWGLCYRMTGSAADADDLVQDTFARAMESPPPRTDIPWRPWLVRVAMNLSRDLLRRRKRRGYVGPWLPSPIETPADAEPPSWELVGDEGTSTAGRYDLLESVSFAFLLALEALTPQKRAVLLLRDVFDYTVRETAAALDLGEANVKTTLHRARREMAAYDATRRVPTAELQATTRRSLEALLFHLSNRDTAALEALLAADARGLSDGGGEFQAALAPLRGPRKIIKFYTTIAADRGLPVRLDIRLLNGLPAFVCEMATAGEREAKRFVIRCDLGADGRVAAVHSILASRKLTAVRF